MFPRHLVAVGVPRVDHAMITAEDPALLERFYDWNAIKHAVQLFSMDDVSVDPSGNRNEVFAGGYLNFADSRPITWTADQLGKAIFYIQRELNDRFLTVVT